MAEHVTGAGTPLPDPASLWRDPVLILRFWNKVKLSRSPDVCWEWRCKIGHNGYGYFHLAGKTLRAHRLAFALHHGRWPDSSLMVLHSCHNRKCVNPHHLREGTAAENQADVQDRLRERNERGVDSWRNGNPSTESLRGGSPLSPADIKLIREKLAGADRVDESDAAMVSLVDLGGKVNSDAVLRVVKGKTFKWV